MKNIARFVIPIAAIVSSTSAIAQPTLLDQLLGHVLNGGKSEDSSPNASPLSSPNAPKAAMSEEQKGRIDNLLIEQTQDSVVAQERNEAQSLIKDMLDIASCGKNDKAWTIMNRRHMSPSNYRLSPVGLSSVAGNKGRYHDDRYCYDVVSISGWKKPAANALAFKARFISPISEEAFSQSYVIQKSPEGLWMIRSFSYMS